MQKPNGAAVDDALPAAAALELVHTFSLVHDDLPALDDDDERRGRPSAHVAFGEGVALLAGDALLAEAAPPRSHVPSNDLARELVDATLGMIGGQYRDITGDDADLEELHRLKTGRLFVAAVRMGLDVAGVGTASGALARVRRRRGAPLPGRRRPPRRRRLHSASGSQGDAAVWRIESPSARVHGSTSWTPTRACCESSSTCSRLAPVEGWTRPGFLSTL